MKRYEFRATVAVTAETVEEARRLADDYAESLNLTFPTATGAIRINVAEAPPEKVID